MSKLKLDETLLQSELRDARRTLGQLSVGFYELMKKRNGDLEERLSQASAASCEAFEQFLAVPPALMSVVPQKIQPLNTIAIQGVWLWAYWFSSIVGIKTLEPYTNGESILADFPAVKFPDNAMGYGFRTEQIKTVIQGLSSVRGGKQITQFLKGYFEHIASEAKRQGSETKYESVIKQINAVPLEVNGVTVSGFDYRIGSHKSELEFSGTTYDEVIGNVEAIEIPRQSIIATCMFDFKNGINPVLKYGPIPWTFLFTGPPGSGKTTIIDAHISYLQRLCEKYSKPFEHFELGGKRDPLYGVTEQKLSEPFNRSREKKSIVAATAEELDGITTKRGAYLTDHIDKAVTTTFLRNMSGAGYTNPGNMLLFASTNTIEDLDPAVISRFGSGILQVKGVETPDEHAELYKAKLRSWVKTGIVDVEEWNKIGTYSKEQGLDGRSIESVCKRINLSVHKGLVEEEMIGMPPEEAEYAISSRVSKRKITEKMLYEQIQLQAKIGVKAQEAATASRLFYRTENDGGAG